MKRPWSSERKEGGKALSGDQRAEDLVEQPLEMHRKPGAGPPNLLKVCVTVRTRRLVAAATIPTLLRID
jgi:hypothetical protein